ncbi:hypothetical protein [Methylocucumis oryzae]|nr:hypothetical protein [Methylocucumis oryzae]
MSLMLLATLGGFIVIVWFYLTAKEKGESPIQWVIIGVIGYWLTWWLIKLTLVNAVAGLFAKSFAGAFLIRQVPALCAITAAYLIRKKLLADLAKKSQ